MSRAGLIGALVTAALTLSPSARADYGDWRTPFTEIKFFTGGGAGFATSRRATSAELVGSGWAALPSLSPTFEIGFGLASYGWSIDLHLHGSDVSFQDRAGTPTGQELHRGAMGVEVGYRLWLGRGLSVSPHVGLASLTSTLCFAGHPDSASSLARPPFQQVLANPGRQTCLGASALGLDVGLAPAWNLRLTFPNKTKGDVMGMALSVGPRVSYTLPLSVSRTWGEKSPADHRPELPSFQGPIAPLGEAYLGIEFQVRYVVETLSTSVSSFKAIQ